MLTARMKEALVFIEEYQALNGESPSHQDLADGIGGHKGATTDRLLTELEERGFIRRPKFYRESHSAHYAPPRMIQVLKPMRQRIPIFDYDTHRKRGWLP